MRRIFYYLFIFIIMGCLLDIGEQTVPHHSHHGTDERAFRIKPRVCTDRHNVQGICMFQWECRQRKGNMLATCLDRFLFGTCCELPKTNSSVSVSLQHDDSNNNTDNGSVTVNNITEQEPLPSSTTITSTGTITTSSNLPSVTATSISLSTPDVEKIFHHFLGSVLSNYSNSRNESVTDEESTSQTFFNETTPFTLSETYSDETAPPSTSTLSETTAFVTETYVETTDQFDDGINDYEVDRSTREPETTININNENEIWITKNASSTLPIVLVDTTTSSILIVETQESFNESHDQGIEDETIIANDEYYDTDTEFISFVETVPTTITTTSTTTTTTTEATTTITTKVFDYKKDDDDTRFLFFSWSWWSLVYGLLALPALIQDWLTGSNVVNECSGALACEPQTSETASADSYHLPNEAYCGVRPLIPNGRIVGGTNSRFGEWPWQVLIKEATWLGLFVKNKCGGVLLNQRYVVTAAHCQPGFLASLLVIFGDNDLSVSDEEMKPLQRNVRRVIVHRKYNALTFDNDLALLELERPVDYHPHIVPICMPPDDEDFIGRTAVVSGWGRIKHGGRLPTNLQFVEVPIMTNSKCQQMFLSAGHIKVIGNKFICAGYQAGGKDSCEGDSGGPLVLQGEDGRWVLGGTVSHGIKCAYPNLPGVYIKISAYKSWIEKIINS